MKNLNYKPKGYIDLPRYPDMEEIDSSRAKYLIQRINLEATLFHEFECVDIKHNKEIILLYKKVLEKISKYLNNNLDNITLLTLLGEMLYSGVFSYGGYYEYSINPENELETKMGLNILYGKGCCRNEAVFLYDLLKELNIKAVPISGAVSPVFKNFFESNCIHYHERVDNKKSSIFLPYIDYVKQLSNHMIIVVPYKDSLIGYDITNCAIYKINGYKANLINGVGNIILVPTTLTTTIGYNFNDVMDVCDALYTNEHNIDKNEMISSYNEGINEYRKSKMLIKEIKGSIESDLEEINKMKEKVLALYETRV